MYSYTGILRHSGKGLGLLFAVGDASAPAGSQVVQLSKGQADYLAAPTHAAAVPFICELLECIQGSGLTWPIDHQAMPAFCDQSLTLSQQLRDGQVGIAGGASVVGYNVKHFNRLVLLVLEDAHIIPGGAFWCHCPPP